MTTNFVNNQFYIIKGNSYFQTLDEGGRVPILGSISAIGRIILGAAIFLQAGVKQALAGSSQVSLIDREEDYVNVLARDWHWIQGKCALHEVARGVMELVPLFINIIECKAQKDETLLNQLKSTWNNVHSIFGADWIARKDTICADPRGKIHYFNLENVKNQDSVIQWTEENGFYLSCVLNEEADETIAENVIVRVELVSSEEIEDLGTD